MDTIDTPLSAVSESVQFHNAFNRNVQALVEPVRDTLIESVASCTQEEIIGQLLINELCDDPLTLEGKIRLTKIADHMGPDWAQALYHAVVFITRVA